jgi:hypothetical protein
MGSFEPVDKCGASIYDKRSRLAKGDAMPESQKSFRVHVTLQGDLARAFIDEFTKRIRENPSTIKSEIARDLMVEGLNALGYNVKDTVKWGGNRQRQDEEEGQMVAVAVA